MYGVQAAVNFLDRQQPYAFAAVASEYPNEILEQGVAVPIHLAGYSSGAVLAFEMARQLGEAGHRVGLLALIDGEIGNRPDT